MVHTGPWFEVVRVVSEPEENYLARGFRDVDRGAAHKMAQCLEDLDSLPSFQRYKT